MFRYRHNDRTKESQNNGKTETNDLTTSSLAPFDMRTPK